MSYPNCSNFLVKKGLEGPIWENGAFRFWGDLKDSHSDNVTQWQVSLFDECIILQDLQTKEALRYDGVTDSQKLEVLSTRFEHIPDVVSPVNS